MKPVKSITPPATYATIANVPSTTPKYATANSTIANIIRITLSILPTFFFIIFFCLKIMKQNYGMSYSKSVTVVTTYAIFIFPLMISIFSSISSFFNTLVITSLELPRSSAISLCFSFNSLELDTSNLFFK